MTQKHDAPEGGAKLKQFALERLDGQPMLRFGALDGFVFEDPVDEGILANLKVWLNHMLESDRGFVDRVPGFRTFVAYPAEHERERPDASAMFRALAHHDGVPDEHRPSDNEPLRNCLPGVWPTIGDLRATLSGQPSTPPAPAPSGLVDAVRQPSDDKLLDELLCAATADFPSRNELRNARSAVLSRMKGTSR